MASFNPLEIVDAASLPFFQSLSSKTVPKPSAVQLSYVFTSILTFEEVLVSKASLRLTTLIFFIKIIN